MQLFHYLSGSDDGSIELWSVLWKKPTHILKNAHAPQLFSDDQSPKDEHLPSGGKTENGICRSGSYSLVQSGVSSVAVCRSSDLAASGAANGAVRLWAIESDDRSIQPLFTCTLVGCINKLAFAKSGRFLLAGSDRNLAWVDGARFQTHEMGLQLTPSG